VSPEQLRRAFRVHPERAPAFAPPDPAVLARCWPLVERLLPTSSPYDEEVAALLPDCRVRTLVLFGVADGVIPPANGRTYRRLLPNCSFQLVYQAAHDIQGDRAEAFADLVGDFLDRGLLFLLPQASSLINP
jgi:pimeloyl-ACP methyl ester carboxylesterase